MPGWESPTLGARLITVLCERDRRPIEGAYWTTPTGLLCDPCGQIALWNDPDPSRFGSLANLTFLSLRQLARAAAVFL